jgi:hypothetical protein
MHILWNTLRFLKITFCYNKTHKADMKIVMVQELLNANDLDYQHNMFKLTMKSNVTTCVIPPFDMNFLTKMQHLETASQILLFNFHEYMKLVELALL